MNILCTHQTALLGTIIGDVIFVAHNESCGKFNASSLSPARCRHTQISSLAIGIGSGLLAFFESNRYAPSAIVEDNAQQCELLKFLRCNAVYPFVTYRIASSNFECDIPESLFYPTPISNVCKHPVYVAIAGWFADSDESARVMATACVLSANADVFGMSVNTLNEHVLKKGLFNTDFYPEQLQSDIIEAQMLASVIFMMKSQFGRPEFFYSYMETMYTITYDSDDKLFNPTFLRNATAYKDMIIPQAIAIVLKSNSIVSALDTSLSIPSSSAELSAAVGSIAEAYFTYSVPTNLALFACKSLNRPYSQVICACSEHLNYNKYLPIPEFEGYNCDVFMYNPLDYTYDCNLIVDNLCAIVAHYYEGVNYNPRSKDSHTFGLQFPGFVEMDDFSNFLHAFTLNSLLGKGSLSDYGADNSAAMISIALFLSGILFCVDDNKEVLCSIMPLRVVNGIFMSDGTISNSFSKHGSLVFISNNPYYDTFCCCRASYESGQKETYKLLQNECFRYLSTSQSNVAQLFPQRLERFICNISESYSTYLLDNEDDSFITNDMRCAFNAAFGLLQAINEFHL